MEVNAPGVSLPVTAAADPAARESTLTLTRRLGPQQRARRAALVTAARALAADGGYAAVTMHDVAARAGVARATVYRYFASKDHLLGEVAAAWAADIVAGLERRPPTGRSAAARVAVVLDRVIDEAEREPELTAALVEAATSRDPTTDAIAALESVLRSYLDPVVGEGVADRRDVETVLAHVLFASLVGLALQGRPSSEVRRVLRVTARVTLPERS